MLLLLQLNGASQAKQHQGTKAGNNIKKTVKQKRLFFLLKEHKKSATFL